MAYPLETPRLVKSSEQLMNFPTNGGGFYFVATPLDVEVALPFEITPSIYFDRADKSQIEVIRASLDKSEDEGIKLRRMYYETDWIRNDDVDPTKGLKAVPIAERQFRYHIISFSGYGHDVHNLLKLMFILEPCISAFAHFYTTQPFGCGRLIGRGGHVSANESFYFGLGLARVEGTRSDKRLKAHLAFIICRSLIAE